MSKTNKLVKQSELFERLSIYGNKSSFLARIAQRSDEVSDDQMKGSIKALNDAVASWVSAHGESQPGVPGGRFNAGIPSSLWDASTVVKNLLNVDQYNVDDLAQANQAARSLAAVLTFKDMSEDGKKGWAQLVVPAAMNVIDNVAKQQKYIASFPKPEPVEETNQEVAVNTAPKSQKPAQAPTPTISKELQTKLNNLLVTSGDMLPISEDGLLGPQTTKALDKFREVYHVPGNYSTEEALEVLKNTAL